MNNTNNAYDCPVYIYVKYQIENYSISEIADMNHVGRKVIETRLKKFKIEGHDRFFRSRKQIAAVKKRDHSYCIKNLPKKRNGKYNNMYGKYHTEETKKIIGDKNRGNRHTKETKIKMSKMRKGRNHPVWKGGLTSYCRRIARKAWEKYWNKKIPQGYCIHHKDENIRNNSISNLALLSISEHISMHNQLRVKKKDSH